MMKRVQNTDELPAKYSFISLDFVVRSETLVATVVVGEGAEARWRIFWRRLTDHQYSEIRYGRGAQHSYRSVVTSRRNSAVFFNQWTTRPSGGSDWVAILRYDFETGTLETAFSVDDISPGEGRVWVSDLLAIGDDDATLYCVIGRETTDAENMSGDPSIAYAIGQLSLRERVLRSIGTLSHVFL